MLANFSHAQDWNFASPDVVRYRIQQDSSNAEAALGNFGFVTQIVDGRLRRFSSRSSLQRLLDRFWLEILIEKLTSLRFVSLFRHLPLTIQRKCFPGGDAFFSTDSFLVVFYFIDNVTVCFWDWLKAA